MDRLKVTCQYCHFDYIAHDNCCPHCDTPGEYPNVLLARGEKIALEIRHAEVCVWAREEGLEALLQDFQDTVQQESRACMNRSFLDVRQLVEEYGCYANFYKKLQAGIRFPKNNAWDRSREIVDSLFFPHFKERICFAALTLDLRGLEHYGACCMIFAERMIAHRTTFFHENSVQFVMDRDLKYKEQIPDGFRATWEQRAMLAIAKAGKKLTKTTTKADFSSIVVQAGTPGMGNDSFIEGHIFRSFTVHSLRLVSFPAQPHARFADDANMLENDLRDRQIPFARWS
ncbi:MAG: hypothetical protein H7833_18200 [Magnetococcus sp. DMHC-1]|nr:hypothetical protein [Magnetococcales bacterium]